MSPRVKSALVLAAVFLLGAVTGGGLVTATSAKRMRRLYDAPPAAMRQRLILNRLSREVELDQDQQQKVESLVAAFEAEQQALRREIDPQMLSRRRRLFDDIRGVLRPEQMDAYERFVRKAENRAKARERR